jgi:hypothetical protein
MPTSCFGPPPTNARKLRFSNVLSKRSQKENPCKTGVFSSIRNALEKRTSLRNRGFEVRVLTGAFLFSHSWPKSDAMMTNDVEFGRSVVQLTLMCRALAALRCELYPIIRGSLYCLRRGPEEEIRQVQPAIDVDTGRDELARRHTLA